jgi:hypothetical protein
MGQPFCDAVGLFVGRQFQARKNGMCTSVALADRAARAVLEFYLTCCRLCVVSGKYMSWYDICWSI